MGPYTLCQLSKLTLCMHVLSINVLHLRLTYLLLHIFIRCSNRLKRAFQSLILFDLQLKILFHFLHFLLVFLHDYSTYQLLRWNLSIIYIHVYVIMTLSWVKESRCVH